MILLWSFTSWFGISKTSKERIIKNFFQNDIIEVKTILKDYFQEEKNIVEQTKKFIQTIQKKEKENNQFSYQFDSVIIENQQKDQKIIFLKKEKEKLQQDNKAILKRTALSKR
jgi:hypothetical protein